MGKLFTVPEPFQPRTPTVSFTLDSYPRQPDAGPAEKVFRIKSHHGYYSTLDCLKKERASIERYLDEHPEATAAEIDVCHRELEKIAEDERSYDHRGSEYLAAFTNLVKQDSQPKLLIIDDMDMGFRDYTGFSGHSGTESGWGALLRQYFNNDPTSNHIIVLLGRSLPHVDSNDVEGTVEPVSPQKESDDLWSQLETSHAKQTIIIVNADLLRYTGAPMSKRTSWERTAEDCIAALENDSKLAPFRGFAHVIIRFGVVGAIHYYGESPGDKTAELYYDSKAHDGVFRSVEDEGGIVGNNSVFASCIAKQLLNPQLETTTHKIGAGIIAAIPACQRFFRAGYGEASTEVALSWLKTWSDPVRDLFGEPTYKSAMLKGHNPTHSLLVDQVTVHRRDKQRPWRIAIEALGNDEKRIWTLAHEIVMRGADAVLNNPFFKGGRGPFAPLGTFGNLKSIDREELDGFYALANILRQYGKTLSDNPLAGPMSIAVFGPPGSGKSYTVREIIKGVNPEIEQSFFEINMAQMSSTRELASYLLRVHDSISAGKTPLVFFDEFDCALDGSPLGWLKYFLAPMEGGTFKHPEEGVFRLVRGIFVFAGGTQTRYDEFERAGSGGTKNVDVFTIAKAPDFLSRLRGHINVKGINAGEDSGGTEDSLYPLRRAIILRSILERGGLVTEVDNVAQIDKSILKALLTIRNVKRMNAFKYDARSLRAIIDMCLRLHGRIEKASLPPPGVLDMHIDSGRFYEEMERHPSNKFSDDIQTTT
jgi:hypothetical protein